MILPFRAGVLGVRRPASAASVAALLVVSACTGAGGPLDQGADSGALCAPVGPDGTLTFGMETLVNSGNEPAEIETVHLVEPSGMSIIESVIVTIPGFRDVGGSLIGVLSGYPPDGVEEWHQPIPAEGAEITPQAMTEDVFNLVVGLRIDPDVDRATAAAVSVAYTVNGHEHTYVTTNSIELLRVPCS